MNPLQLLRLKSLFDPMVNGSSEPLNPNIQTLQLGEPNIKPANNTNPANNINPALSNDAEMKFNELISQYPKKEDYHPSVLRQIGGMIAGGVLGPEAGSNIINAKFNQSVNDWKNQLNPRYQSAQLERQGNVNERTLQHQTVSDTLKAQAQTETERKNMDANTINQQKLSLAAAKQSNPDLKFDFSGPTVLVANPKTGEVKSTGIDTGSLSDVEKMGLQHENRIGELTTQLDLTGANAGNLETQRQTGREELANTKGWETYNVPNADGTIRVIAINPITKQAQDITSGTTAGNKMNPLQGPVSKAGVDKSNEITNQTKTMMEGAQMMLPHIKELKDQATSLEKRGLFGPVMSRIRNLAAKFGTTGSPEQVQASLEQLSNTIMQDPQLSNDAAVGQFAVALGLMASGVGRVHGGARGGGSIQMVNYMKSLLSADSTLPMFLGRLNTLDSYMKGYAAGPSKSGTVGVGGDKLNAAIDKILSGVK